MSTGLAWTATSMVMSKAMTGSMWMPTLSPTIGRLLRWHPQPIPVFPTGCGVALLAYAIGVARLQRRSTHWSVGRSIAFLAGLCSILAVTGTGIGGYGMRLFSMHMIQHMVLSMLAPVLLLLGAPVTLALRAIRPAPRGRRGPRELLLRVVHSRLAWALTSPLAGLPLFIASLYGLYFTPIFDVLMSTWLGHTVMLAHFLGIGLLFFYPILAVDPAPHRVSHPIRMGGMLLGVPFHAFFGIALMMSPQLVAGFFAHPPTGWGVTPIDDQSTAGGIAWAFTEIPTVLVLLVVFIDWWRSDQRQARREDRAADRDGDARLVAYNDYLRQLSQSQPPR